MARIPHGAVSIISLLTTGLFLATPSASFAMTAEMPMTDDDVPVRPYADGAGPSAIFRLGRLDDRGMDVFAIVDPLRWRIQYYTLSDWSLEPESASFRTRWKPVASCRLSPTFRVWRVHSFPTRIVLQSQPIVPRESFIFPKGSGPAPLSFHKVVLSNDAGTLRSISDGTPTADDQIPTTPCAAGVAGDGTATFDLEDAATTVSGGQKVRFDVERRMKAVATPFDQGKVHLSYGSRFLSSAQELEEGVTVRSGQPIRHFLLTTRTQMPGFVSTEAVLVRRGKDGKSAGAMTINLGLNRVKLGQRPVAVSSKGEVLVLGAPDHGGFRVHRCTYLLLPGATTQCRVEEASGSSAGKGIEGEAADPDKDRLRRAPMWKTAFDYSQREFRVDTGTLPDDCRKLVIKCSVAGIKWTPLPELRGGQKGIVLRAGFPYGQVSARKAGLHPRESGNRSAPGTTTRDPTPPSILPPYATDHSLAGADGVTAIAAMDGAKPVVFGDINNDGAIRDPDRATVFGIDCSSFISMLWGLSSKWDTAMFIAAANENKSKMLRIAGLDQVGIGDAFVINIAENTEDKYINHIVLFRETRNAGPSDSSQAMLVVESNGSCAGVCWSFYDESFLNGWGILRHAAGKPSRRIVHRIPTEGAEWRGYFAR